VLQRRQGHLARFAGNRYSALKPLYLALPTKGCAATQSIILGRQLLGVAFAAWEETQSFDPTRLVRQDSPQKRWLLRIDS